MLSYLGYLLLDYSEVLSLHASDSLVTYGVL